MAFADKLKTLPGVSHPVALQLLDAAERWSPPSRTSPARPARWRCTTTSASSTARSPRRPPPRASRSTPPSTARMRPQPGKHPNIDRLIGQSSAARRCRVKRLRHLEPAAGQTCPRATAAVTCAWGQVRAKAADRPSTPCRLALSDRLGSIASFRPAGKQARPTGARRPVRMKAGGEAFLRWSACPRLPAFCWARQCCYLGHHHYSQTSNVGGSG